MGVGWGWLVGVGWGERGALYQTEKVAANSNLTTSSLEDNDLIKTVGREMVLMHALVKTSPVRKNTSIHTNLPRYNSPAYRHLAVTFCGCDFSEVIPLSIETKKQQQQQQKSINQ